MEGPVEPTYGIMEFDFYMRFYPDDVWSVYDVGAEREDSTDIPKIEPYGAAVKIAKRGKIIFTQAATVISIWVRMPEFEDPDTSQEIRISLILWGQPVTIFNMQFEDDSW
jgi:hypothetical protein